jgi:CRISPR-associated endonuclease/helicase Cas3
VTLLDACKEISYRYYKNEPRKYQEISWNRFLDNVNKNKATLVRLSCGYGKTFIGLAPFIAQAVQDTWEIAPRLIYVLPMRTLANEVRDKAVSILKELGLIDRLVVRVLHGEAPETPHLFSDISVTTLDSFLYNYARKRNIDSWFGDKHTDFSAGSIANSMVVFDEAHMYQGGEIQVLALFGLVIKYLVKAGIPVLIMTATMPKVIRDFIFYDISCDDITYGNNGELEEKEYEITVVDKDILDENIRDVVSSLSYRKLLIVVNTVDKAIKIKNELNQFNVIILHSRIRSIDKEIRLEKIKRFLNENNGVILISTQVCEAGLDFDFDTLITDMAPADSLVQRIGRVARRGGKGKIIFYKPKSAAPYEENIVNETARWLETHISEIDFSKFSGNNDIYGVQEFVDASWEPYRKTLWDRCPSESELYFRAKGCISEPDLDFNVRGTEYVILVAPHDGGKLLLSGGILNSDEFENCKFTVDMEMVKKYSEWIVHPNEKNRYMMLCFDREKQGYMLNYIKKVIPYQSYLVNSFFYSDDVGLRRPDQHDI